MKTKNSVICGRSASKPIIVTSDKPEAEVKVVKPKTEKIKVVKPKTEKIKVVKPKTEKIKVMKPKAEKPNVFKTFTSGEFNRYRSDPNMLSLSEGIPSNRVAHLKQLFALITTAYSKPVPEGLTFTAMYHDGNDRKLTVMIDDFGKAVKSLFTVKAVAKNKYTFTTDGDEVIAGSWSKEIRPKVAKLLTNLEPKVEPIEAKPSKKAANPVEVIESDVKQSA